MQSIAAAPLLVPHASAPALCAVEEGQGSFQALAWQLLQLAPPNYSTASSHFNLSAGGYAQGAWLFSVLWNMAFQLAGAWLSSITA